ncbi:hypothetical protein BKA66DRAFT_494854 [Pyrenochaeta sp. MPI-SDFR-AT-0127]|nr:hypothetical protein BKA66DRAFT_494854 [Pyrenochaeta sp. MPI-SDFR-AT-0127]
MGVLAPFTSPHDPRWQGLPHYHHNIFIIKNVFLILFIIVVIIEYPLFMSWWNRSSYKSFEYAPYSFWFRIGIALVPELVYTTSTVALILGTPTLSLKGRTWTFHPAFALTFSIGLLGLYALVATFNTLIVYSNEVSFYNLQYWYFIAYVEAGLQAVLGLSYLGMMVLSSVAVHRWRIGKIRSEELGDADKGKDGMESTVSSRVTAS